VDGSNYKPVAAQLRIEEEMSNLVKPRGNETPPPIVRPQKLSNGPVGTDMKKSILADVNKQIIVNTSGKSGGS